MDCEKRRPPKCQVCLSSFRYNGPEPYILPCLHSVCSTCLVSNNSHELKCYDCQETFKKETFDFPKDAVRAKEIFLSTAKKSPSEMLCTNREDGNQAESWCQECEAFLCHNCQEYHKVMKVSRNHVVLPLTTFVQSGGGIRVSDAYCHDHQNHPLQLYDQTCGLVLCYKCHHKGHGTCDVEDINSAYDNLELQLKDGIGNLTGKLEDIEIVETKVQDLSTKLDTQKGRVKETVEHIFSDIRYTLNKREEDVSLELEHCFKIVSDRNKERLVALEMKRSRCKATIEFNRNCLDLSDPLDMVKMKSSVVKRTTACIDDKLPTLREEECYIDFSQDDLQDLKEFILSFGGYHSSVSNEASSQLPSTGRIRSMTSLLRMYEEKIGLLQRRLQFADEKLANIPKLIDGSRNNGSLHVTVNTADPKEYVFSESICIKNMTWYMGLHVTKDDESYRKGCITVFLHCENPRKGTWSCYVSVDLKNNNRLQMKRCQNYNKYADESYVKQTLTFTDAKNTGYQNLAFITRNELLNPINGYVKDGNITFEANIAVQKTTGMSDLHDLLKEQCSLKNLPEMHQ